MKQTVRVFFINLGKSVKAIYCAFAGHTWKTFPAVPSFGNGETTYICNRCEEIVSHNESYVRN